jgi:hypothetical protein
LENISTPCATPAGHATGETYVFWKERVITITIIYHEVKKRFRARLWKILMMINT